MQDSGVREKVVFKLGNDAWHGYQTEALWAKKVEDDVYQLDNSPFFANDVSYRDVIAVERKDGQLFFQSVKKRSGHSTYRVILNEGLTHHHFTKFWEHILKHGCTYEHGDMLSLPLYTIDVPHNSDIEEVYAWLVEGENEDIWDFEEAHYFRKLN